METVNLITNKGHGTTHRITVGRTFTLQGYLHTNTGQGGKADCGSITSSAARVTDGPVTCPKCIAIAT